MIKRFGGLIMPTLIGGDIIGWKSIKKILTNSLYIYIYIYFFFETEFQPMASAPDDSSLSSDQDINQFLM